MPNLALNVATHSICYWCCCCLEFYRCDFLFTKICFWMRMPTNIWEWALDSCRVMLTFKSRRKEKKKKTEKTFLFHSVIVMLLVFHMLRSAWCICCMVYACVCVCALCSRHSSFILYFLKIECDSTWLKAMAK